MKGVTFLRVTYRPRAECQDETCAYGRQGEGRTVRSGAQQHVLRTGHNVDVIIEDRSFYAPEDGD